jgi:hypothetical protein
MAVRETTNLVLEYSPSQHSNLCNWITAVHDASLSSKYTLTLPDRRAASNLQPTKIDGKELEGGWRIDCQTFFHVDGHPHCGWYNLQVQENVTRGKGQSTTVFTTYVHHEAYMAGRITSSIILKAMKQQALHRLPEYVIFRYVDGKVEALGNVPRSPHGILTWGQRPYQVI